MTIADYEHDDLEDDISAATRASTLSQHRTTTLLTSPEVATVPASPLKLDERNVCNVSPRLLLLRKPLLSQALHIFLSGMVIPGSIDPSFEGHFTSLGGLLLHQPLQREAAHFAAEAVALSSLARRVHSSELQLQATKHYYISIRRLRTTDLSLLSNTTSTIACIVLWGIYEVFHSSSSSCCRHCSLTSFAKPTDH